MQSFLAHKPIILFEINATRQMEEGPGPVGLHLCEIPYEIYKTRAETVCDLKATNYYRRQKLNDSWRLTTNLPQSVA